MILAALLAAQPAGAATYAYDKFDRTDPVGSAWSGTSWGPSSYGGTWSEWDTPNNCANPNPADDFKVEQGVGKMKIVASANRCQRLDINRTDAEISGTVRLPTSPGNPSGASIYAQLGVRAKDHQNRYHIRVEFKQDATAWCRPQKVYPHAETGATTTAALGPADNKLDLYSGAGEAVHVKISAVGDVIKAKCWTPDEAEPAWEFTETDTADTDAKPDPTGDHIVARATTGSALSETYDVEFDDIVAYPVNPATYAYDEFERPVALGNSWGTSTDGGAWSEWTTPCTTADKYSVDGGTGKMLVDTSAANRCQRLDVNSSDAEIYAKVSFTGGTPGGIPIAAVLGVRAKDDQNRYQLTAEFKTDGTATCRPKKAYPNGQGGTTTVNLGDSSIEIPGYNEPGDNTPGEPVNMKLSAVGDVIRAKCWADDASEPTDPSPWQWTVTDTGTKPDPTGDHVIVRSTVIGTGLTTDHTFEWDNLVVYPPRTNDPNVAAVGDIACRRHNWTPDDPNTPEDESTGEDDISSDWNNGEGWNNVCHQRWVSDLICGTTAGDCDSDYETVIVPGDLQYECGMADSWVDAWGQVDGLGVANGWQRVEDEGILAPVPGNHEYDTHAHRSNCGIDDTSNTQGECYFQALNGPTFSDDQGEPGQTACSANATGIANPNGTSTLNGSGMTSYLDGYYSFDVGTWKLIGLNSQVNCSSSRGPSCVSQKTFLANTLESNLQPCVAVFFHHPRYSSYSGSTDADIASWWDVMYKGEDESKSYKVDLVLNAHAHNYERFAKMDDTGAAASDGIRQFVVGTGGRSHYVPGSVASNSEARNPDVEDPGEDFSRATDPVTEEDPAYGLLELVLGPNSYQYRFRPSVTDGHPLNGIYTDPSGGVLSSPVSCNS